MPITRSQAPGFPPVVWKMRLQGLTLANGQSAPATLQSRRPPLRSRADSSGAAPAGQSKAFREARRYALLKGGFASSPALANNSAIWELLSRSSGEGTLIALVSGIRLVGGVASMFISGISKSSRQKDVRRVALPPAAQILQMTCHRGPSPYYLGGRFWRCLMYSAGAEIRAWQQGKKKVKWAYNHSPGYLRCSLA